jgi:hypothetical protein
VTGRPIAAEARAATIGMNQSQFQNAKIRIKMTTGIPIQASRRTTRGFAMRAEPPHASPGFNAAYQKLISV